MDIACATKAATSQTTLAERLTRASSLIRALSVAQAWLAAYILVYVALVLVLLWGRGAVSRFVRYGAFDVQLVPPQKVCVLQEVVAGEAREGHHDCQADDVDL